jgi:hypothetical protein
MHEFCKDRFHIMMGLYSYVRPRQRDILVEGVYYAGVREYISIQHIDHYSPQRTAIILDCYCADGRVLADLCIMSFINPTGNWHTYRNGRHRRTYPLRCLCSSIARGNPVPKCEDFILKTLTNTGILYSQGLIAVMVEYTKRWMK